MIPIVQENSGNISADKHSLELFDTGPKIKRKMLQLIADATDYILIDTFLFIEDSVTRELLDALAEKHRSGIRIYVLADSCSRYIDVGRAGYTFLEEAGIPFVEYNPLRLYKLLVAPIMLPRDHRKFWIVDGRILFLGGANVFASSLKAPEDGGNIDLMVTIDSAEAIAQMIESFVATWNASPTTETLCATEFAVRARSSAIEDLWIFDQNQHVGRRKVVARMLDSLFERASREVWLVQPYTFVTSGLLERIRGLTGRGVEVNIMLAGEVQAPRFHYASFYGIEDLLEDGVKVWIYEAGKAALHAKAVIVDGRWASIGSANLNLRSLLLSQEANVIFSDEESVGKLLVILEELKKNCRPVEAEEAGRYRSPEYYLAWLWMQLAG